MIKVCVILKKELFILANYWVGCSPPPHVATASEVINRKTLNDLRFVKCYPCKCHDFVNQFILTIQLYYIFSKDVRCETRIHIKGFKRSLVKNIYLDELSTASLQSSTGRLNHITHFNLPVEDCRLAVESSSK